MSLVVDRRHKNPPYPQCIVDLHRVKQDARKLWEQTRCPPYQCNYNRATRELKKALRTLNLEAKHTHLSSLDLEDGFLGRKQNP
jgi:hypothetical protein